MTDNADLFAEWAQQHLQQQTGNIAHEFFTTENTRDNKDD